MSTLVDLLAESADLGGVLTSLSADVETLPLCSQVAVRVASRQPLLVFQLCAQLLSRLASVERPPQRDFVAAAVACIASVVSEVKDPRMIAPVARATARFMSTRVSSARECLDQLVLTDPADAASTGHDDSEVILTDAVASQLVQALGSDVPGCLRSALALTLHPNRHVRSRAIVALSRVPPTASHGQLVWQWVRRAMVPCSGDDQSIANDAYAVLSAVHSSLALWCAVDDEELVTLVLAGLKHTDPLVRRRAGFLLSTLVQSLANGTTTDDVWTRHCSVFAWNPRHSAALAQLWNDYLIVLETLEQSMLHLVEPLLPRFRRLYAAAEAWGTHMGGDDDTTDTTLCMHPAFIGVVLHNVVYVDEVRARCFILAHYLRTASRERKAPLWDGEEDLVVATVTPRVSTTAIFRTSFVLDGDTLTVDEVLLEYHTAMAQCHARRGDFDAFIACLLTPNESRELSPLLNRCQVFATVATVHSLTGSLALALRHFPDLVVHATYAASPQIRTEMLSMLFGGLRHLVPVLPSASTDQEVLWRLLGDFQATLLFDAPEATWRDSETLAWLAMLCREQLHAPLAAYLAPVTVDGDDTLELASWSQWSVAARRLATSVVVAHLEAIHSPEQLSMLLEPCVSTLVGIATRPHMPQGLVGRVALLLRHLLATAERAGVVDAVMALLCGRTFAPVQFVDACEAAVFGLNIAARDDDDSAECYGELFDTCAWSLSAMFSRVIDLSRRCALLERCVAAVQGVVTETAAMETNMLMRAHTALQLIHRCAESSPSIASSAVSCAWLLGVRWPSLQGQLAGTWNIRVQQKRLVSQMEAVRWQALVAVARGAPLSEQRAVFEAATRLMTGCSRDMLSPLLRTLGVTVASMVDESDGYAVASAAKVLTYAVAGARRLVEQVQELKAHVPLVSDLCTFVFDARLLAFVNRASPEGATQALQRRKPVETFAMISALAKPRRKHRSNNVDDTVECSQEERLFEDIEHMDDTVYTRNEWCAHLALTIYNTATFLVDVGERKLMISSEVSTRVCAYLRAPQTDAEVVSRHGNLLARLASFGPSRRQTVVEFQVTGGLDTVRLGDALVRVPVYDLLLRVSQPVSVATVLVEEFARQAREMMFHGIRGFAPQHMSATRLWVAIVMLSGRLGRVTTETRADELEFARTLVASALGVYERDHDNAVSYMAQWILARAVFAFAELRPLVFDRVLDAQATPSFLLSAVTVARAVQRALRRESRVEEEADFCREMLDLFHMLVSSNQFGVRVFAQMIVTAFHTRLAELGVPSHDRTVNVIVERLNADREFARTQERLERVYSVGALDAGLFTLDYVVRVVEHSMEDAGGLVDAIPLSVFEQMRAQHGPYYVEAGAADGEPVPDPLEVAGGPSVRQTLAELQVTFNAKRSQEKRLDEDADDAIDDEGSAVAVTVSDEMGDVQVKPMLLSWDAIAAADTVLGAAAESERLTQRTHSDLIVIATLVDKAVNLGGMSRTGEVFGVHTLVVSDARVAHSADFRTTSMSSERWLRIASVPEARLPAYFAELRAQGYTVLGVEQTANSVTLQEYQFPRKTAIIVGSESRGLPAPLLQECQDCVEIPQYGLVRSLNVHVTASLCVYEYTKQHVPQ